MQFLLFNLLITLLLGSCKESEDKNIYPSGKTIRERILPPKGYQWVHEENGSFGAFLQNLQLKNNGSKILDYQGNEIFNQHEHVAIINYDIGKKDLQQCADAVIRLHAEFLFAKKRFQNIKYHFTSGDVFSWDDYKNGFRPNITINNDVTFLKTSHFDDSYTSFRKYLDIIYMYAGTISLNKETNPITDNSRIEPGNILITPGSPGHVVIIVGKAINKNGKSIYLLAEGYTPAQSIHVISNPFNNNIGPWYELDVNKSPTITARYMFNRTNIRSFDFKSMN
jgi:hypothetical protein